MEGENGRLERVVGGKDEEELEMAALWTGRIVSVACGNA